MATRSVPDVLPMLTFGVFACCTVFLRAQRHPLPIQKRGVPLFCATIVAASPDPTPRCTTLTDASCNLSVLLMHPLLFLVAHNCGCPGPSNLLRDLAELAVSVLLYMSRDRRMPHLIELSCASAEGMPSIGGPCLVALHFIVAAPFAAMCDARCTTPHRIFRG